MNETKAALKEIAQELRALIVTVAALEAFTGARSTGHKYADARNLLEQANQTTFSRLESLIDSIPDDK